MHSDVLAGSNLEQQCVARVKRVKLIDELILTLSILFNTYVSCFSKNKYNHETIKV